MCRKLATLASILLIAGVLGSCSSQAGPAEEDRAQEGSSTVRKDFGAGPVKFSIELSAGSITTADALTCTMVLRVNEGYEAEFPDLAFPVDLPGMILVHVDQRETIEGNQLVQVGEYELEPEYAGKFELPALQVYYHREDEVKEEMLETDPIEFAVTETPASAETLELKPFHGLVTVEQIEAERRRIWPSVVSGTAAGIVLIVLAVYLIRRPGTVPPPPPPHVIAMEALRALAAKDLIAKGLIEPFFVEITCIVREYVEWAFGLRAPEQTTEEFLANITSAPAVAEHRDVLEPFLTAADEVKFAQATPDHAGIQRTFDTARDFILATSGTNGGGR